ncbi:MAG: ATP-dependent helicase [Anaerolineae bacterium]|nr:ATP-dependent helicase [Anaerolineae bacterium]
MIELLERLWQQAGFQPNDAQRAAILHTEGPLYLPAGPGSGKTRVLLWRTVNLIAVHGVPPEAIFLSTFTEKAARQLREGLRALLGLAGNVTGRHYDISQMYVGTVHSLCQRLLSDRRIHPERQRSRPPTLLDDLDQYFHLYDARTWQALAQQAGCLESPNQIINALFERPSNSRHEAVINALAFFNRLSEECLSAEYVVRCTDEEGLRLLARMYDAYVQSLRPNGQPPRTDFALLQQEALRALNAHEGAERVFQHVIVDEYQDTNPIQERLFFRLAQGSHNLCVVGDDDQALYRFRGATVENFVQFPQRCQSHFGRAPTTISLDVNYRSRRHIVSFYTRFMAQCDWTNPSGGHFRVTGKSIRAASDDEGVAVVASTLNDPEAVAAEIANLVVRLLETKRVEDPSQIAFLFPSLKASIVQTMKDALEARGLKVYAPRASTFLEVPEATKMFGLFALIFGTPERVDSSGGAYEAYWEWLEDAQDQAEALCAQDRHLDKFVAARQDEIARAVADYKALERVCARNGWSLDAPYEPKRMKRALYEASRLSDATRRKLGSPELERAVERRSYALGRFLSVLTALDWNVLDLFYRLCGFKHFKAMFDLAERGEDEGPICNLSLISQYLARFNEQYGAVLSAPRLRDDGVAKLLFGSYLYALYRLGEGEYENPEDPFPKGRIPFLTIHQAKGLEFPVVVLGSPCKKTDRPPRIEALIRPLLDRKGEPLDRMAEFDAMRLFYVALSRAKNLLVIAYPKGQRQSVNQPFRRLLEELPKIPQLKVAALPEARLVEAEVPRTYSYNGDYLFYTRCPRQYMVFRKYGFAPSRTETMLFGTLVHRTIEDLHNLLIARRRQAK